MNKKGERTNAADCIISLQDDYNFNGRTINPGGVAMIGPVKRIGDISLMPSQVNELTWTSYAAAQVGYGYILEVMIIIPFMLFM